MIRSAVPRPAQDPAPASAATEPASTASGRKRGGRRKLRILGVTALTGAGLLLTSTTANLIIEQAERSAATPYGQRVQVSGGELNVYREARTGGTGGAGETIVLLSGLGTAAPALDFAPLIRELRDYDVVVVEGFGYGYSDLAPRERTVENITAELHEALSKLNINGPYILAGHSIAGFYTLFYANQYRAEVSAVIGIDPTVPAAGAEHADASEPPPGINWGRMLSTTGLVRWASTIAPALVEPEGDGYTSGEREQMRLMTSWNFANPAVVDETNRIADNARKVHGLTYPDDLPVLTFLAGDKGTPPDPGRHENRLHNVRQHEIVVLAGGHYLHWTQAPAMAEKITAFLKK
jgi:pimeloyl-ACP methyl ester carboxylesterase